MEWLDVAKTVAGKGAPYLGSFLAGKAGADVGSLIARKLGVEENAGAVLEAVQRDPEATAKLKEIEAKLEMAEIQAAVEKQRMVNETMRAELKSDGWFKSGWRPALGYIFTLSMGWFAGVLGTAMLRDPTLVGDSDFMGAVIWLVGSMAAALGINIKKRSDDKKNGVSTPGFLGQILKRRG